jgi:macrolide transport system ATP-binding/permease protein
LRDVTPGYLPTLKARLIRGRLFTEDDDAGKPQVAVINETMARKIFPGEDPIGKTLADPQLNAASMRQIVGEIEDVREGALDDAPWSVEYSSIYQNEDNAVTLVVRTAQSEAAMLPALVGTLHQIDPNLGISGEETMNEAIDATATAVLHRATAWMVGGFAFIALALGVVGLYGVIAFSVSQRTREIGVRMALGAQRGAVYGMVLWQAGWLTAIGLAIGLAGAVGSSLLMRNLLFGVAAYDGATLTGVAALLGITALAASYLPARRAASVNPVEALRTE